MTGKTAQPGSFKSAAIDAVNFEDLTMSIPVELSNLADAMARYRFAYLLTANPKGAPHAVAVTPVLQGRELVVSGVGRRTRENAQQQSAVGLVWPPQSEADYSLIVDGTATAAGELLRIAPTRAVLHRPAPSAQGKAPGGCVSDCVEIELNAASAGR
ncbi:MAG TPA: hypothetical protein VN617_03870 [Rhodoferax sp.]|nr:hypothetical protein [Rhodoferax sp.]